MSRIRIEPDPAPDELVAILTSMQPNESVPIRESSAPSRWSHAARREQMRKALEELWSGWSP